MTLDEGIKHAEEVMVDNLEKAKIMKASDPVATYCFECAEELRQLAEWLKELKAYREREPSYEAGYNDAKREIALSGEYKRAYDRGYEQACKDGGIVMKWIDAEQKVTVTIYDEEHEEHLDKIMTVEEMLDTYTNEGCPTMYSNPEQAERSGEK